MPIQREKAVHQRHAGSDPGESKVAGESSTRCSSATPAPRKIAWVSSWNSRCGIAAYSEFLLREISRSDFDVTVYANQGAELLDPDGEEVVRCWEDAWKPSLDELRAALAARAPELVVFQFNFAFFPLLAWGALLDELHDRGTHTIVTFHATRDVDTPDSKASLGTIRRSLARCDRLLVHGLRDLGQLERFGLSDNVTLFPHGALEPSSRDLAATRRAVGFKDDEDVVATFGFLLPHKGTLEIIEAFPRVLAKRPRARLLLVNALYSPAVSAELQKKAQLLIRELGLEARVTMINDFLEEAEALCLLECADLLVYPYQQTDESASGALRLGLAARRPIAVTPLSIFDDVGGAVHRLPSVKPTELAAGILELLADPARRASTEGAQRAWLEAHAWPVLARRLGEMMQGILGERSPMSERSEGGESRLDEHELLARVRAVVRQTAPADRQRVPDLPIDSESSRLLGRADHALSLAEHYWQVGSVIPPMTRVRGLLRKVAVPLAKAILRAAELVARDQRSYNRAVLDAMGLMRTALEELPRLRKEARDLRDEVAALRPDATSAKRT